MSRGRAWDLSLMAAWCVLIAALAAPPGVHFLPGRRRAGAPGPRARYRITYAEAGGDSGHEWEVNEYGFEGGHLRFRDPSSGKKLVISGPFVIEEQ